MLLQDCVISIQDKNNTLSYLFKYSISQPNYELAVAAMCITPHEYLKQKA